MEGRLLTRGSKLLLASVFLNTVPLGFMNVVPLVYLAQIGYDPNVIGAIYAASAVTNSVGLIPMGYFADRYGRKWFLVAGSALPCISYAIFGLTLDPAWMIVASALGGIGFAGGFAYALANPAVIPLLANTTTDRNRSSLFGFSQAIFTLGLSLGALLGVIPSGFSLLFGLDSRTAHFDSYFLMSGLVIASVVPLLFFTEERTSPTRIADESIRGTRAKIPRLRVSSWPRMLKLCAIFVLTGLAVGVIVQLLPTWYTLRFGVSEDAVGEWTALANAASIAIIPIVPRLVRRMGTLFSSAATGVSSAALLALMPITGSFEGAAGIFIIRTLLEAMSWAMLLSYTMGVVPEVERATATGITLTAWGVGAAAGTYVGGLFLGSGSLLAPFLFGIVGYVLASVLLIAFFRVSKLPEEMPGVGIPAELRRATDK